MQKTNTLKIKTLSLATRVSKITIQEVNKIQNSIKKHTPINADPQYNLSKTATETKPRWENGKK